LPPGFVGNIPSAILPRVFFMQLDIFYHSNYNQLVEELFEAYFACRKNKRNPVNALRFERELEVNVFRLADEIFLAKYTIR
jgi:hypothetical protein